MSDSNPMESADHGWPTTRLICNRALDCTRSFRYQTQGCNCSWLVACNMSLTDALALYTGMCFCCRWRFSLARFIRLGKSCSLRGISKTTSFYATVEKVKINRGIQTKM